MRLALHPAMAAEGGFIPGFYRWSQPLPLMPGVMVHREAFRADWLPQNTQEAFRILYTATDGISGAGQLPVSGYVLIPRGPRPANGWPVVIWAHGTTGVADMCAPSVRGIDRRDNVYLDAWLGRGFMVVATDYQGLGTPGPHPYLLYRPEAYSLLDAARAVLADKGLHARNEMVLVGQSQGAGAGLAAAWMHPRYAPDLAVKAAVLTGLVATVHRDDANATGTKEQRYTSIDEMDAGFVMLRLAGSDQAIHPTVDLEALLNDRGKAMLNVARHGCLHDLFGAEHTLGFSTGAAMFGERRAALRAFDRDFNIFFELPNGHVTMPVFVGTGLADGMAGTAGQYDAVSALCRAGSTIQWHTYPGVTHGGAVNYSFADSLPFVRNILAGRPVQSSCQTLEPPGPVQSPRTDVPFN
ncbi:alpha/beta hydrolase [Acidomonas methanolica]|uniref:alpha/beta hydrolase n=1 Tax=Acidomonas methanolica TaxID=437 RepID=UPI00211A1C3B|nr:lipase family protein [Acidomonas methanolica]MCQ9154941.1 lipase [Acidomonas methanolica]